MKQILLQQNSETGQYQESGKRELHIGESVITELVENTCGVKPEKESRRFRKAQRYAYDKQDA